MDFSLDATQQAVADVVTAVLDRNADTDDLWPVLAANGVTSLAVPERLGGDGVGLPEAEVPQ